MSPSTKDIIVIAIAIAVWPALFVACPPTSSTKTPIDASDAAFPFIPDPPHDATVAGSISLVDCEAACAAMDRAGCVTQVDCARVMCAANSDPRFTHYNTVCLEQAARPSDVAVCGVTCLLKTPSSLENPQ
jgi:hypothetical protein